MSLNAIYYKFAAVVWQVPYCKSAELCSLYLRTDCSIVSKLNFLCMKYLCKRFCHRETPKTWPTCSGSVWVRAAAAGSASIMSTITEAVLPCWNLRRFSLVIELCKHSDVELQTYLREDWSFTLTEEAPTPPYTHRGGPTSPGWNWHGWWAGWLA